MSNHPALAAESKDAQSNKVVPAAEPVGAPVGPYIPREPPAKKEKKPTLWATLARRQARLLGNRLFVLCVLLPTSASVVYFGFFASDVYVSEARFVVRTPQRNQQSGLVGALLQGTGFQRSQDDAFTVHDYMNSRDALRELDKRLNLKTMFANPELDLLTRFPLPWLNDSFESLYKYYLKQISVNYDPTSSITTLEVRAFTPKDSHEISVGLVTLGEALVNQINERARLDLITYATAELNEAESKAKAAGLAIVNYRNRRGVFDPDRQGLLQLQQVNKLQDELIATKLQLAEIRALSPTNPQVDTLRRRARSLEAEKNSEMAKVAGGGNSITDKAGQFERLQLERTFADRQFASAMSNLESARTEARRKQLYLERIVQPNMPDYPLEPRRMRAISSTFVFGLIAWGALAMLFAGVREHRD